MVKLWHVITIHRSLNAIHCFRAYAGLSSVRRRRVGAARAAGVCDSQVMAAAGSESFAENWRSAAFELNWQIAPCLPSLPSPPPASIPDSRPSLPQW